MCEPGIGRQGKARKSDFVCFIEVRNPMLGMWSIHICPTYRILQPPQTVICFGLTNEGVKNVFTFFFINYFKCLFRSVCEINKVKLTNIYYIIKNIKY